MKFIMFRSPRKSCLVKYFKRLTAKRQRAGKGHILFSDQTTHIGSPKGTVPLGRGLARTLALST